MTQLSDLDQFQTINVGSTADDGTGDNLRNAFVKVNNNFTVTKNVLAGLITASPGTLSLSVANFMANLTDEERNTADNIRLLRDLRLQELDALVSNPMRYAAYSDNYKLALAAYRQHLLDVPDQPGFPTSVAWPILPIEN